jgi:hypothetical protein
VSDDDLIKDIDEGLLLLDLNDAIAQYCTPSKQSHVHSLINQYGDYRAEEGYEELEEMLDKLESFTRQLRQRYIDIIRNEGE